MIKLSTKVDFGGLNLKEVSLLILVSAIGFSFVVVGISFYQAIVTMPESAILIAGQFDIGQWQAIVLGIAMIGAVLVSQQLTKRNDGVFLQYLEKVYGEKKNSEDSVSKEVE